MEHKWKWDPFGIYCPECGAVTIENPPPALGCEYVREDRAPRAPEVAARSGAGVEVLLSPSQPAQGGRLPGEA
ncbi:MAG: hypothetical protein MUQ56_13855 [Thermoleophilia bacterium]|nr:hypothetical protein [Thermoleophilia bacterium]